MPCEAMSSRFSSGHFSGQKEPKLSKMLFISAAICCFLFLMHVLSKLGHAEKRLWVKKLHCKFNFYLSFWPVFFSYILLLCLFLNIFLHVFFVLLDCGKIFLTKTLRIPKIFSEKVVRQADF